MATLNDILKVIDQAPVKFNAQIPDMEKSMFRDISVLLKDLQLTSDGKIQPSIENLKLINSIKGKLDKILVSKEYANLVKEFVGNFPTITNFQTGNYDVPTDTKKMISETTRMNIDHTLESLIGSGYKQEVVSKLYKTLLTNVTSGASYADMVENLRNQLTTTEQNPGMLSKYTRTYVTDALGQLAGQGNKMIADSLDSEWFQYVGSNLTTTREFCRHLTKKRYVHKSEIPTILAGEIDGHQCRIYEATGLPMGMIEGTNEDNFTVNRGGYNCGHELIPVNEASVPQNIKDKIQYPQKSGLIGKNEPQKLASNGLMSDPLQVNSFLKLVDFMREKTLPRFRSIAFNKMLENENYTEKNGVYIMNGAKLSDTELHSAEKLTKAGYHIVFPNEGHIKQIKKLENSIDSRKNDIYIYDKKTFIQSKVDIKTINSGSIETISNHIISGSGQAPVIAMDIQGGTKRNNLIEGLKKGWCNDTKKVLLNWKGQWYEIDHDKLFSNWIYRNIK